MAKKSSSEFSSVEVQPWDIALADLEAYGAAAVRAIEWVGDEQRGEQFAELDAIWRETDQLAADCDHETLSDALFSRPQPAGGREPWFAIQRLRTSSVPGWWEVELSLSEERAPREGQGTCWLFAFGRRSGDPFSCFHLVRLLGDWPFEVTLEAPNLKRRSLPEVLRLVGRRSARSRKAMQAIDVLSAAPVVLVDPKWKNVYLAESVMAQLIDWIIRVQGKRDAPALADDALIWWHDWVGRAARRRPGTLSLGEAYEVAPRSVRPATPAGHRVYWRESLRPHSDSLVNEASAELRISRTTIYNRLRQGQKHLDDFRAANNPLELLAQYLREQAPADKLAPERRQIVDILIESGMKPDSARKLERRVRNLPEAQQQERVFAALARLRKSSSPGQ